MADRARGRRPPPPPRRPRAGRCPPGPQHEHHAVAGVAQLGGERRDGPCEPRRRCARAHEGASAPRRRGTAGPSPSGGAVPRPPPPARRPRPPRACHGRRARPATSIPKGSRTSRSRRGGHVAPRAVVVGAAEQRSRTGDRPPPTRRRRPRAPRRASARGDRAGAPADRPPAAATRAAPRPRDEAAVGRRPGTDEATILATSAPVT